MPPQEEMSAEERAAIEERRARRKAYGLTQAQAADRLRVSLATFYRWETGQVHPSGKRAEDYERFLRKAPLPKEKTE